MFRQYTDNCGFCATLRDGKRRFMELYNLLGFKFLCTVIVIEHILQAFIAGGGGSGLIGAPIMLLLSTFHLTASRMQVLETVAVSPWQFKPLIGILADCLYIGGYNKLPYIIVTSIMGIISAITIVSLYPVSPLLFTALLFFLFLQIATSDLLIEARYVEKTKHNPGTRHTLYSFVHFCSGLWQLASICLVGVLISQQVPLQWLYLSPVAPFIVLTLLVFSNWIGERVYDNTRPLTNLLGRFCWFREYKEEGVKEWEIKGRYEEIPLIGLDTIKIRDNWRVFLLACIIGLISLATSLMGLFGLNTSYLFGASVTGSLLMIACFFVLLERRLAKVQTFVVIQNMFSISLRAGTFFFYTDPVEAYPEGPHFSRQFYVTIMGGLGILVGMLGALIYGTYMHNWTHRRIFMVTSLLYILTCIPNILLFKRLNLGLGIPDSVFVLGSEVVQVVVAQLNTMPFGVIMLNLCPTGMEASMYAIMAGSNNLGAAFASYQGAFVLEKLDIKPCGNMTGESSQFDNLWIASLISLCIQIVPLFFIPFLVPDAKQTDDLLLAEDDEPLELPEIDNGNVNTMLKRLNLTDD